MPTREPTLGNITEEDCSVYVGKIDCSLYIEKLHTKSILPIYLQERCFCIFSPLDLYFAMVENILVPYFRVLQNFVGLSSQSLRYIQIYQYVYGTLFGNYFAWSITSGVDIRSHFLCSVN